MHLRRADGRSIDGILHVNPTLAKTQVVHPLASPCTSPKAHAACAATTRVAAHAGVTRPCPSMHTHARCQRTTQGLAFFFNPTPRNLSTTVALPLYYTGATTAVHVAREGDAATRAKLTLARDYSARVPVQLAARSFAWFTIDRLDDDGGGDDDGDGGGDDDAMPRQQVVEA